MQDHYVTLGITSNATLAHIKTAFRQQASRYHPDKNPSPDAAALFRAVQSAYEILSNEDSRAAYDENRRRSLLESPLETAKKIWQNYLKTIVP